MEKPEPLIAAHKLGFLLTLLMNMTVIPMLLAWTGSGIILFPLLFVVMKFTTPWDKEKITRQLIWIYGRISLIMMTPFVRFKSEGLDQNGLKPPCILVANHLSFFDIYSLALLPFGDVSITIRNWPFKMFWYAPFMRLAGYVNVESLPWQTVSKTAAEILTNGGGILFFPEGHRSRTGQIQRYYSGAFRLAVETGAKIVPICITGTDRLWPPGRIWLKPARVKVRALKPVDPAKFKGASAHRAILKVVKARMAENLKEMTTQNHNESNSARQATAV
jgi:1-acyl-sn-glycerol-3-phosphate acyltransferase